MEYMRNIIKLAGGVVMIFAAVFEVADFRLPAQLEAVVTYVAYIAYILLLVMGYQRARDGYRSIRGR